MFVIIGKVSTTVWTVVTVSASSSMTYVVQTTETVSDRIDRPFEASTAGVDVFEGVKINLSIEPYCLIIVIKFA